MATDVSLNFRRMTQVHFSMIWKRHETNIRHTAQKNFCHALIQTTQKNLFVENSFTFFKSTLEIAYLFLRKTNVLLDS